MFAVIKIAGQQFRVQPGQSLYVPHLGGEAGDKIEFSEILLHDNDGKISLGTDATVTVKAEIVHKLVKGEKVIAFSYESGFCIFARDSDGANRYILQLSRFVAHTTAGPERSSSGGAIES